MPKRGRKAKTQRVPRTRAGCEWTEAKYIGFFRAGLRKMHLRWPGKHLFKERNRRDAQFPGRHKYELQCSECDEWMPEKCGQIDHIVPCGQLLTLDDLPGFVARMFCEPNGYQFLCHECHKKKTDQQRQVT